MEEYAKNFFSLILAGILALSGSVPLHAEDNKTKDSYTLAPGDKVSIKIYPSDEYIKSTETEISPEGNVTLPLVGKIPVAGKTATAASQAIANILDADYLV